MDELREAVYNWPMRRIHALTVLCATCLTIAWAAAPVSADVFGNLASPFERAVSSGSFGFALALVFLAGVATSLTPCVYPMIAITVSVFGARQVANHWQGARLSTAFVLGIAALFTPLGLFASLTGGVFGDALANPIVLVCLAILFSVLAVSMLGGFSLDLPPSLRNRLAQVGGSGLKGSFALGVVSGLVAAPCTGPVLGFLLTWVATTGNVVFGALSLFVYSLGLGLLFWLVGTFSVALPKSGQWLDWIKSFFGIVMFTAAIYYVRDVIPGLMLIPRKTNLFLFGSLGLMALGFVMGAIHLSYYHPSPFVRLRKTLGIGLGVIGLSGVIGYLIAMPPGAKINWLTDYQQAKQLALASHKPLLVDVGASWCGACQELDRHTFSHPLVVREAQRFVAVRVDLSPGKDTHENRQVLIDYNQKGLPLVVMHNSQGQEVDRLLEFIEARPYLKRMRRVR